MLVSVKVGDVTRQPAELLAVPVTQVTSNRARLASHLRALDRVVGGGITRALETGDFKGRPEQCTLLYPVRGAKLTRVLLVGLGDPAEVTAERLRSAAGESARRAAAHRVKRWTLWVPSLRRPERAASTQALTEGAVLGSYQFDLYREKREEAPQVPRALTLFYDKLPQPGEARRAAREGQILAESQNLARVLSDQPANELPPAALASQARRLAREVGLKSRVMGPDELKRRKMGGLLAVGKGSANSPRLIVLEHNPGRRRTKAVPTLCVVGKGITFDSGGISIKPATGMQEMKHDMSGAAAVVGIMRAAALLELPLHLVGVIAAAENMPGGSAYRPGDIVQTMSGKHVEVVNTDAEGRVVLADALYYAQSRWKPEVMLDLATLTGACKVALGPWATGVFGNDSAVIEALRRAGDTTGEIAWPMPLFDQHQKAIQSSLADLKNTGGRDAGASLGAAFLGNFVGETPWAHLDIAGTGWTTNASSYHPCGATGVGVRLVVEFLRSWERDRSGRG